MTITTSLTPPVYLTTGTLKTFNIPFEFTDPSHITVTVTDRTADPVSVTTIDPANYTVTQTPYGTTSKGVVTYPKAPTPALSAGYYVTIGRNVPVDQTVNLINQSGFFLEDIEKSLDKLTMICQQLREIQSRSILLPVGGNDTPTDYLDGLEAVATRAENAADRAEAVEANLPASLFQDVLTTSSSTYTLTDTHNGTMIAVSPPSGGTAITLPQLTGRTTAYTVSIRNMTGIGTITISTVNSETINYKNGSDTGALSITLTGEGDEVILMSDLTLATANKWVTFGYRPDGTLPLSRLSTMTGTSLVGNAGSTSATPAIIPLDAQTITFRDGKLSAFGALLGTYAFLSGATYDFGADATKRGAFIQLDPLTTMTITLPSLTDVTVVMPICYLIRRVGDGAITLARGNATDEFAPNLAGSGTATSYTFPTTVGTTVLLYGVTSGAYAGRWIPVQLV